MSRRVPDSESQLLLRLQCVILGGCKTEGIAIRILTVAPRLEITCWSTLVEDNAARAFSSGFYASIAQASRPAAAPTRPLPSPTPSLAMGTCRGALRVRKAGPSRERTSASDAYEAFDLVSLIKPV